MIARRPSSRHCGSRSSSSSARSPLATSRPTIALVTLLAIDQPSWRRRLVEAVRVALGDHLAARQHDDGARPQPLAEGAGRRRRRAGGPAPPAASRPARPSGGASSAGPLVGEDAPRPVGAPGGLAEQPEHGRAGRAVVVDRRPQQGDERVRRQVVVGGGLVASRDRGHRAGVVGGVAGAGLEQRPRVRPGAHDRGDGQAQRHQDDTAAAHGRQATGARAAAGRPGSPSTGRSRPPARPARGAAPPARAAG